MLKSKYKAQHETGLVKCYSVWDRHPLGAHPLPVYYFGV